METQVLFPLFSVPPHPVILNYNIALHLPANSTTVDSTIPESDLLESVVDVLEIRHDAQTGWLGVTGSVLNVDNQGWDSTLLMSDKKLSRKRFSQKRRKIESLIKAGSLVRRKVDQISFLDFRSCRTRGRGRGRGRGRDSSLRRFERETHRSGRKS